MKKIISIVVSLTILVVIYWKIDFPRLIEVFQNSDRLWMVISLGMVVPLTMLTAWRLQQLTPSRNRLEFGEANRLILTASVLNMVLPSKMGDIAKAYFIKEKGYLDGSLSLSLVVFEKACDMLSLLLWCAFGLTLYPQKDWLFWIMTASVISGLIVGTLLISSRVFANLLFQITGRFAPKKMRVKVGKMRDSWKEMHKYFWKDRRHLLKITLTSIVIWFGHLLQIWFFTLALKAWVPFLAHLALAPLAILAGLLPLTFAGVGTRDAALIAFYQPYMNAPTAAALGLLCTSRYILPALGGIPFLSRYLTTIQKIRKTQNKS